jgi:hypothetical protein
MSNLRCPVCIGSNRTDEGHGEKYKLADSKTCDNRTDAFLGEEADGLNV